MDGSVPHSTDLASTYLTLINTPSVTTACSIHTRTTSSTGFCIEDFIDNDAAIHLYTGFSKH